MGLFVVLAVAAVALLAASKASAPAPAAASKKPASAEAIQPPRGSSNDQSAERAPAFIELVKKFWPAVVGDAAPSEAAQQALVCIAWLEAGIGGWWQGAMKGSWNRGAIQCLMRDKKQSPGTPPPHYRCELHKEHRADGSEYDEYFRYYQDADSADVLVVLAQRDQWEPKANLPQKLTAEEWSVFDFLYEIWMRRRPMGDAIAAGKSVTEIADQARRQRYHGVSTEKYANAIMAHAGDAAKALGQKPRLRLNDAADTSGVDVEGIEPIDTGWRCYHDRGANEIAWYRKESA